MFQRALTNLIDMLSASARWAVLVIFTVMYMCTLSAKAESALVVLSSQSSQYSTAADECKSRLNGSGFKTRVLRIDDVIVDEIHEDVVVIALGVKAASSLAQTLDEDVHLYYALVSQPDRIGLTDRPNTSGISADVSVQDQLSIIRQAAPGMRSVGLLYNSKSSVSRVVMDEVSSVVTDGFEIRSVDLNNHAMPIDAIRELYNNDVGVVWMIADPQVYDRSTVKSILIESIRNKVPVFGFSVSLVRAGAAFGVSVNPQRQGARVADLVQRNAVDTHLDAEPSIVVNEIVGDRIDHTFPMSILSSADTVIDD
jgi:ABC-type uncharacterized transport system substrate-binding protein